MLECLHNLEDERTFLREESKKISLEVEVAVGRGLCDHFREVCLKRAAYRVLDDLYDGAFDVLPHTY